MLSRASGKLLRKLTPESPPRPKNIFMDCCVRSPCVLRRSQMCGLRFDLRTRKNREPATLTLGIFCVRTEISCDQKQLRSRTASTWLSFHAHKDLFLQNDCCDLAPPDRLMHTKMLPFRHGGIFGSQSMRKKTWISIMINKQVHAIKKLQRSCAAGTLGSHSVRNETSSCDKTAAFSRRKHTWISLRAQRDMFLRKDYGDPAPPPI